MALKWTYDSEADDSFSYKGDLKRTFKRNMSNDHKPGAEIAMQWRKGSFDLLLLGRTH